MPTSSTSLTAAQLSTCLYMQKQAAGGALARKALPWLWGAGKKLLPKAVRHSKATAPLRAGFGNSAKQYGEVMSGLGRFGSRKAGPKWAGRWDKLRDAGYRTQNWGMLQDDIISTDMIGKAGWNPLTWWRAPVRGATGLTMMGLYSSDSDNPLTKALPIAYWGPGVMNLLTEGPAALSRLRTKPPQVPAPRPPTPPKFNPYLAKNAPRGYRR